MSYYFQLNISKKLSTIWTEMQLINWIPWWVCVERVDSQPHKNVQNGNFSSNLWSVLKMAAHGRFSVQRWFKIASFDANGSFGICRTHSKTLRRIKYSKNIVFVPKLSCTSPPFYLTCPDPDGGIAPCLLFCKLSCACGFWPRCHASFHSRFPLTIKELWRHVLKRRCNAYYKSLWAIY